jgi:hypothetical protein
MFEIDMASYGLVKGYGVGSVRPVPPALMLRGSGSDSSRLAPTCRTLRDPPAIADTSRCEGRGRGGAG